MSKGERKLAFEILVIIALLAVLFTAISINKLSESRSRYDKQTEAKSDALE